MLCYMINNFQKYVQCNWLTVFKTDFKVKSVEQFTFSATFFWELMTKR